MVAHRTVAAGTAAVAAVARTPVAAVAPIDLAAAACSPAVVVVRSLAGGIDPVLAAVATVRLVAVAVGADHVVVAQVSPFALIQRASTTLSYFPQIL